MICDNCTMEDSSSSTFLEPLLLSKTKGTLIQGIADVFNIGVDMNTVLSRTTGVTPNLCGFCSYLLAQAHHSRGLFLERCQKHTLLMSLLRGSFCTPTSTEIDLSLLGVPLNENNEGLNVVPENDSVVHVSHDGNEVAVVDVHYDKRGVGVDVQEDDDIMKITTHEFKTVTKDKEDNGQTNDCGHKVLVTERSKYSPTSSSHSKNAQSQSQLANGKTKKEKSRSSSASCPKILLPRSKSMVRKNMDVLVEKGVYSSMKLAVLAVPKSYKIDKQRNLVRGECDGHGTVHYICRGSKLCKRLSIRVTGDPAQYVILESEACHQHGDRSRSRKSFTQTAGTEQGCSSVTPIEISQPVKRPKHSGRLNMDVLVPKGIYSSLESATLAVPRSYKKDKSRNLVNDGECDAEGTIHYICQSIGLCRKKLNIRVTQDDPKHYVILESQASHQHKPKPNGNDSLPPTSLTESKESDADYSSMTMTPIEILPPPVRRRKYSGPASMDVFVEKGVYASLESAILAVPKSYKKDKSRNLVNDGECDAEGTIHYTCGHTACFKKLNIRVTQDDPKHYVILESEVGHQHPYKRKY